MDTPLNDAYNQAVTALKECVRLLLVEYSSIHEIAAMSDALASITDTGHQLGLEELRPSDESSALRKSTQITSTKTTP